MIDCYNFDYDNEREVSKVLDKINKKLDFYMEFRLVKAPDGGTMFDFSSPHLVDKDGNFRKGISASYGRDAEKMFSKEIGDKNIWNTLGAATKATEISRWVIMLYASKENKQKTSKVNKMVESLIRENELHLKDIDESLMFLLALRTNILEKIKNTQDENEKEKLAFLADKYYMDINSLFKVADRFNNANAAMLINRRLVDPFEESRTEATVANDINKARSLLNYAKNKSAEKSKDKTLLFNLCNIYSKLDKDKNIIDEVIDVTRALITKEINAQAKKNFDRLEFINKIKVVQQNNSVDNSKEQSIYKYLDEQILKDTTNKFFSNNSVLSSTEKLARLQALRLSTINTMEELKDYLTKNRSEITMKKTINGKVEITIGRSGESDNDISYDRKMTTENKYIGKNTSITYIYDPMLKEVEGYKLSGQAYFFSKDMKEQLGKNLTNEFNMFLGNLEATTNISILNILNTQIPIPKGTSVEASAIKLKDKFTAKVKDIDIKLNTTATAATVGISGFTLKPSLLNLSISPELSTEKYNFKGLSIKESANNFLKEGVTLSDVFVTKIATSFFNASMKGLAEDITCVIGEANNNLLSVEFDNVDGKLQLKNATGFLEDKKELFNKLNDNIAFLRAVITKDDSIIEKFTNENKDLLSINFQNKSRTSQLVEAGNIACSSLSEVKNILKTAVTDMRNIKNTTDNIEKNGFLGLLDKFRKDEELFTINSATTIDNSLIEEKLSTLLKLNLNANDLKQISKLLEKVNEPEKYYSEIRTAMADNEQYVANYLQTAYSKTMTDRIENLIKNKDRDNVCKIAKIGFKNEIIQAFENVKKMDAIVILNDIDKNRDDNVGLDSIIDKYRNQIDKFQETNINTQSEHNDR